jgi:hypothetical protein
VTQKVAEESKWKVKRIANRRESKRPFVWQVICPETPPELSWDNDFGRGMRCGCRRFPTEGKATRYVERMEAGTTISDEGLTA